MSGSTYTQSMSYAGDGALLGIGPVAGTASPSYVTVFEVTDSPLPPGTWDKREVTNLQSPNKVKEFRKGNVEYGEMTVKGNSVATDPGQLAMAAAHGDSTNPYMFQIQMPIAPGQTTTGDLWQFNALVMSWTPLATVAPGKTVDYEAKLQIVSKPVRTAGS